MTAIDITAVLRSELADCHALLPRIRAGLVVQAEPEPMDRSMGDADRERAVGESLRLAVKVRAIRSALDAIRRGEYGLCQQCMEPISEKRLVAIPWAERCRECEELGGGQ